MLLGAGAAQELLVRIGHPTLGILLVVPALAITVWLWRPGRLDASLILVYAGLEALLPIHNGAGRFADWAQHYQVSRLFAGLPATVTSGDITHWTPLSHELSGAVLAWAPSYASYQLTSLLLGVLWLWPARILIERFGSNIPRARILAVGLNPLILTMTLYTWPWAACLFFALAAVAGALSSERHAGVLAGLAAAGVLLTHEGAAGYVIGLMAWMLWHKRRSLLSAFTAGAVAAISQLPWLLSLGVSAFAFGSITLNYSGGLRTWLLTRPLLWTGSLIPLPLLSSDGYAINELAAVLIYGLPVSLLAVVTLARGYLKPPAPVVWTIAGGCVLSTLIYPSNAWVAGMYEGLFIGVVLLVILAAARAPWPRVKAMTVAHAVLSATLAGVLLTIAWGASSSDPNIALKTQQGLVFLVDRVGWLPGAIALAAGLLLVAKLLSTPGAAARRSTSRARSRGLRREAGYPDSQRAAT